MVGPPGLQASLEQQAFLLLTQPERQTLAYYLQEYQEGHIGLQALVLALLELFNTHAKVERDLHPRPPRPPDAASSSLQLSMMAEVRSLVALQDLEIFDRLVVHRDREGLQAWPGGPGAAPPCCCSLQAPRLHGPGHGASLLVSLQVRQTLCSVLPVTDMFSLSMECSGQ